MFVLVKNNGKVEYCKWQKAFKFENSLKFFFPVTSKLKLLIFFKNKSFLIFSMEVLFNNLIFGKSFIKKTNGISDFTNGLPPTKYNSSVVL